MDSICGALFTKKTMNKAVGRLSSMKPTSLEHRFKIRPEDKQIILHHLFHETMEFFCKWPISAKFRQNSTSIDGEVGKNVSLIGIEPRIS